MPEWQWAARADGSNWIPAFAGMMKGMGARPNSNRDVIPAQAGIQFPYFDGGR